MSVLTVSSSAHGAKAPARVAMTHAAFIHYVLASPAWPEGTSPHPPPGEFDLARRRHPEA